MSDFSQIQFFSHAVKFNNNFLKGVQSVAVSQNLNGSTLSNVGSISNRKLFRPISDVTVTLNKVVGNNGTAPPLVLTANDDILIQTLGINTWETHQSYDIEVCISKSYNPNVKFSSSNDTSLRFDNFLLSNLSYEFNADGQFVQETANFIGHSLLKDSGFSSNQTSTDVGDVARRVDFNKNLCTFPTELASLFINGRSVLLSVSVDINIGWQFLTNFGFRNDIKHKYMSLPMPITTRFSILDLGFDQSDTNADIMDTVTGNMNDVLFSDDFNPNREIVINAAGYEWNMGNKNYLVSRSRNGGEAGSQSYTIYEYTYQNDESYLKIQSL